MGASNEGPLYVNVPYPCKLRYLVNMASRRTSTLATGGRVIGDQFSDYKMAR